MPETAKQLTPQAPNSAGAQTEQNEAPPKGRALQRWTYFNWMLIGFLRR